MNSPEDSFPAAEKILADIEAVLKKDLKLKTFEVLPVTQNQNKSPVLHLQHCLGLESWCVPHVYCHAYNHIMSIRQNKRKREDHVRINRLLMGVLMINPDVTTLWNMRKDLVMSGKVEPYFELHFSAVTLSRKPKCADIFAHRKWIIKRLLKDSPVNSEIIRNELDICELAADRYSNNYHAWTHRIWCLSQGCQTLLDKISFYQREWGWSEKWVSLHVSDYSGFQYRQHLLSNIVKVSDNSYFKENGGGLIKKSEKAAEEFMNSVYLKGMNNSDVITVLPIKFIIAEFLLNTDLINNFPGHEALWCHRRFILYSFKDLIISSKSDKSYSQIWGYININNHLNSDGVPLEKDKKMDSLTVKEKFAILLSIYEDSFLKNYRNSTADPNEMRYINRHKLWISKVLKLQLPNSLDLLK